jgi:D-lactate dehydrogenase
MNIYAYSVGSFEKSLLRAAADRHTLRLSEEGLSPETAERARGYEAVLIFGTDDASAPSLEALHRVGVRYLVTRSAGTDHVDLDAARRLKLKVASIPSYSPHAIAEHAVGLMLALGRRLIRSAERTRQFNFELTPDLVGFELHGKTVGIAGFGKIGAIVAEILRGFGARVLAYDLHPAEARKLTDAPVRFVGLDTLLRRSDVVSIHLPLTDQTRGLFGAGTFRKMKRGAMLINTGRGGVLDTEAARQALESGQLGYLGLDVYEHEHGLFFEDHSARRRTPDPLLAALMERDNVLVTGHQAFLTEEAIEAIARQSIAHLDRWARRAR